MVWVSVPNHNAMNKDTIFYTSNINNRIQNNNERTRHVSFKRPGYGLIVTKAKCHYLQVFIHHEHYNILFGWVKYFLVLAYVHSLSILTTVFPEPFSNPLVLSHAYCSRLNFAMLRTTIIIATYSWHATDTSYDWGDSFSS